MLGMEMLIGTVIKSLGIDPDELMTKAQDAIDFAKSKTMDFDARLKAAEAQANRIEKLLLQVLEHVNPNVTENAPEDNKPEQLQ